MKNPAYLREFCRFLMMSSGYSYALRIRKGFVRIGCTKHFRLRLGTTCDASSYVVLCTSATRFVQSNRT